MQLDPISTAALAASALILLMLLFVRLRERATTPRRTSRRATLDTVAAWPPEAARVLTTAEVQALDLLKRAVPGFIVLGQVPLSRFLRVPTRNSYAEWLARVGNLNADLLLCDSSSRVLAVIDVRAPQESDRSLRRHERMVRVLRAAGIAVCVWRQDSLPTVSDVRTQLSAVLDALAAAPVRFGTAAPPVNTDAMPLMPLPEITEVLADGDLAAAQAPQLEPVPSGFFDDLVLSDAAGSAR